MQRILDRSKLNPWRVHYWLSPKVTRDEAFREQVLDIMGMYTRELGADEVDKARFYRMARRCT